MCTSMLPCPLCSLPRFSDLESLRIGLIKVATENLVCPICNDIFMGLDKLTIHLFSHCDSGIFKPDKSIHDDRQKKEKPARINETQTEDQTQIPCVDSNFSKLPKAKHKTTNFSLVEESELQKNTSKSDHVMPMYNINTIPFIGIPENLSVLQRNKKNSRCTTTSVEKSKNNVKNNKLSEKCDICGFCFLGKNILEMHKKLIHNVQNSEIVNGVSKYCCSLCSKVFKMRGSLMVHLRMVHFGIIPSIKSDEDSSQTSPRSFSNTCEGPNFETINSEDINTECSAKHDFEVLITNSRSPEGPDNFHNNNNGISPNNATKQWTCDICKKQFTTKYFLKKHKRLHTGEMPYACNQCNKTFTFQQSYHKHLLYHNDDKPHQCGQCGRAFKELSTLHNHQRIHTGEKPFSCETCGKCFRQRVSYLVHRRIHTGAMPYKCTACEKSFRYKVSQRTHKCTVQPPGTLVRQSGGDLVQKLIKNQKETQNFATNSPEVDDTDQEAINRDMNFSQHFTFDSRRNSAHDATNDNNFIEKLCHNVQHSLTEDLICNENLRPKDVQEREEKSIIDELVSESILKMDFSHPGPSTSQNFNSGVTDLYSMISLQDDILEDSLPSPSEKFKNLKLSPSSDSLSETAKGKTNISIYDKSVQSQGYQISQSNSIDSFIKSRSDGEYGVNDSQLYDSIFQRR